MGARQWQFGTHADLCVHNGTEHESDCSDSEPGQAFRRHRTRDVARWLPSKGLTIRRSPALVFLENRLGFVGEFLPQSMVWLDIEFIDEKLNYLLKGNSARGKVSLAG
jgi:hypothetical protein